MTGRSNWSRRTVVVDLSRGALKVALAESACEAARFRAITSASLASDGEEGLVGELDATRVTELLAREVRRHGWQGMRAACLLSGAATSTQSFLFPPMPAPDLRRAIALKLAENLHFDLEDSWFDFRRIDDPSRDGPAPTLVAAARTDAVRAAVRVLRGAGLRPVAVGAAAESLANLSQCTSPWGSEEASIHVDIGDESTILNLFEGNLLRFSREVDVAGRAFVRALERPILTADGPVQLDAAQAAQLLAVAGCPREGEDVQLLHGIRSSEILPLVEPVVQRLAGEIRRSLDYLRGLLERERIDRIVLSGSAGRLRNLDRALAESLDSAVVQSDPVERAMSHWRLAICDEDPPDLAGFAAILGYSLGLREPINLLPREERLAQAVERVSRLRRAFVPAAAGVGLCFALAGVPISRTYGRADELLRQNAGQLDSVHAGQREAAARRVAAERDLQELRVARGPVPDWKALLKELSAVLPPEAQLLFLELEEAANGGPQLRLRARLHRDDATADRTSTRVALALAASPWFEDVHVVEATFEQGEDEGRFEATLGLLAPASAPGSTTGSTPESVPGEGDE